MPNNQTTKKRRKPLVMTICSRLHSIRSRESEVHTLSSRKHKEQGYKGKKNSNSTTPPSGMCFLESSLPTEISPSPNSLLFDEWPLMEDFGIHTRSTFSCSDPRLNDSIFRSVRFENQPNHLNRFPFKPSSLVRFLCWTANQTEPPTSPRPGHEILPGSFKSSKRCTLKTNKIQAMVVRSYITLSCLVPTLFQE